MALSDFISSIFGGGNEMNDATKLAMIAARNPNAASNIMKQNELNQRASDKFNMAKFADYIYGQPGQGVNPGTGVYDMNVPNEVRLREMNRRMLQTGIGGFLDQWANNQNDMQNSVMGIENNLQTTRLKESLAPSGVPNTWKEYVRTLGPDEAATGPGYKQFLDSRKSGTTINMNDNKVVPLNQLKDLVDTSGNNPPPGITFGELQGQYQYKPAKTTDAAGRQAMLEVALAQVPKIRSRIFDQSGKIDRDAIFELGALDITKGIPLIEQGAKWYASPKAKKLQNEYEIGIQAITRTETGAAMAKDEIANVAARFLPSPSDSDELIRNKVNSFEQFLQTSLELLNPNSQGESTLPPEVAKRIIRDIADEVLENPSGSSLKDFNPTNNLRNIGGKNYEIVGDGPDGLPLLRPK